MPVQLLDGKVIGGENDSAVLQQKIEELKVVIAEQQMVTQNYILLISALVKRAEGSELVVSVDEIIEASSSDLGLQVKKGEDSGKDKIIFTLVQRPQKENANVRVESDSGENSTEEVSEG